MYLRRLANMLIQGADVAPPRANQSATALSEALTARLREGGDSISPLGTFPDGREYRIMQRKLISQRPPVGRAFLRLDDGQTVIWDTVLPGGSSPRRTSAKEDGRPAAVQHQSQRTIPPEFSTTITVPTRDVRALARFYSDLLERQLSVKGEMLAVGEGLRFVQAYGANDDADTRDETVFIALRGKVKQSSSGTYTSTLRVVDPDGRAVHVAFDE